jgi:ABC-type antimicrobial peptide transport system permease subunit
MALGGSRGRLLRLWLTESLLLCLSAGGLSLLFAWWMLDLVVAFKPPTLIGQSEAPVLPLGFQLDIRIFSFALALSVLTAMLVAWCHGQISSPGLPRR